MVTFVVIEILRSLVTTASNSYTSLSYFVKSSTIVTVPDNSSTANGTEKVIFRTQRYTILY